MEATMRKRILLLFIIVTLVFVTSCQPSNGWSDTPDREFEDFTNDIFCAEVSSDSLSLNYSLTHPENYGIHTLPEGFPSFTYENLTEDSLGYENMLATLNEFESNKLSYEQQNLYEILKYTLELRIEGQNYLAFTESLGPTTGIQAQLPVLLTEFRIGDSSDLAQYFSLLRTIPDYFRSLLSIEKKKSALGTLPCRSTISHIIDQCRDFLDAKGTSILETTLENRLSSCTFLTETDKAEALQKNSRLIIKYVIPAYETLIAGLTELLPLAPEDGPLCHYERGKGYYEYLVRSITGSSRPVSETKERMEKTLQTSRETLLSYAASDPSLFTTCQDYVGKFTSPEQILHMLQNAINADFPSCGDTSFDVKYVDKALEDYLSPAFYLTPPIDDNGKNCIYLNGSGRFYASSLFNTLAHEGYPGHLYQTCYMQNKKLPLLRYALGCEGYTEGWASYAEVYAYRYTGDSPEEAAILQNNMTMSLCMYGLSDIGIHYEGWDTDRLYTFVRQYGVTDFQKVKKLYETIIDEPASYIKYAAGYLEFLILKETFRERDGKNYSDKRFHQYVLDFGTAPFDVLGENIDKWLKIH